MDHKALMRALREIKAWNANDIRGYEEITPDMDMLKARRKVINEALKAAKE